MFGWKLIRNSEYEDLQDLVGEQATRICELHCELNDSEMRRKDASRQREYYADQLDILQRELGAERWRDVNSEDVFERWAKQSGEMAFVEETG